MTSYMLSLRYAHAREAYFTVYEGDEDFQGAANAMADDCDIYCHHGVLYNMPGRVDPKPPYFCVIRSCYIGVFALEGWDSVGPKVQGVNCTYYFEVDSLETGEAMVRRAIERGEAMTV
ncbi:hypothetical protein K503DRAFT_804092 [Rhizopogon vinicolor AM-OR11-026]|uniref:Uncharacterized protein n=1 Tax=Rhizopogon vinicolor AM-OR11-026 TaxID=1314800 RepID=A0A1B7MMH4_9AGAM|nr:hypothetical protein K503DRAFT_804092 [Rhizopogon vinicolor AM-OR11-026]